MFGMIWYRSKVLSILIEKFNYKPAAPSHQAIVFNAITKKIKKKGGNEYDGAIGFMLVQLESLPEENNIELSQWKNTMTQIIYSTVPLGKLGLDHIKY